jgi:tripartite-type tricarboxylate transporter receptor subunit TctC
LGQSESWRLTVASNGEGGFPHLVFEHLAKTAGITFTHVPYKGSRQISTDLIGGQVMTSVDGVSGPSPHISLWCHPIAGDFQ